MTPRRDIHWPSLAIIVTGLLSMGPVEILAQTTSTVVCGSSFNWMDNSKNQNPCVVGAYLLGACNNSQWTVGPLPLTSYYSGPSTDEQNECQCSTVTYNTMSACAACQSRGFISWTTWAYNCTTLSQGIFLPGIPAGTAVPAWAFQEVAQTDFDFNVTLAQSVGDNPESTGTNAQSTGSLGATSASASTSLTNSASVSSRTSSSTPTNTSTPTSSGSSSNTGAIAGGVVGGVVGVALIAVVVVFLKKTKPSRIPPSEPSEPTSPPPGYTDTTPFYSKMAPLRLYDPSDPSTFPTSVPPITVMTASSSNIHDSPLNHSALSVHPGGHYRGAPEF